jgi:transcriptional regulator with XRE-family HTH domain
MSFNQKELIQLIEIWNNIYPMTYKTNIKRLCDEKNIKPKQIAEVLQVTYNSARSYTNASHTARIEFLTALKIAEMLEVNIEEFLEKKFKIDIDSIQYKCYT